VPAVGEDISVRSMVVAREVSRRFGEGEAAVDALVDVSLDFPSDRFAAIMGPSGSGKSTLMHILAGLDRPTSGTVELAGVEITSLGDAELTQLRRDRVGFIFQTFNLLPVLSARENILLPLSIAGRKPDEEWFNRLIDTVGIRDRLTQVSSSGSRSRARSSRDRRWSSPTSRPGTSTPKLPMKCCGSCVKRWTSSSRPSSWSPTTRTRPRSRIG
jgi:ABC-type lipoprotein export system ATPase subunit